MLTGNFLAVALSLEGSSSFSLFLRISNTHFYPLAVRVLLTCFTTSLSDGSDTTISAQTPDLLCSRLWLESQFKYWSVWVGLRYIYILVFRESSLLTIIQVSKKGSWPSYSSFIVNFMCWSKELMLLVNLSMAYNIDLEL